MNNFLAIIILGYRLNCSRIFAYHRTLTGFCTWIFQQNTFFYANAHHSRSDNSWWLLLPVNFWSFSVSAFNTPPPHRITIVCTKKQSKFLLNASWYHNLLAGMFFWDGCTKLCSTHPTYMNACTRQRQWFAFITDFSSCKFVFIVFEPILVVVLTCAICLGWRCKMAHIYSSNACCAFTQSFHALVSFFRLVRHSDSFYCRGFCLSHL